MKITIRSRWTDEAIYQGERGSFGETVLAALSTDADLTDADLRGADRYEWDPAIDGWTRTAGGALAKSAKAAKAVLA